MGKGIGKGCTSRKGGKRQRVDSSSDKKPTSAEASATSTSVMKPKENVCPESEFVSCGIIDNACDNNPVFSSSSTCHDGGRDHMILGADGDVTNVAVNHVLSQQHLTGTIISVRNWKQVLFSLSLICSKTLYEV
jgi:hypothetical protein